MQFSLQFSVGGGNTATVIALYDLVAAFTQAWHDSPDRHFDITTPDGRLSGYYRDIDRLTVVMAR